MIRVFLTLAVVLYAVVVPILEVNDTHVFNPAWTPHAKIHEVWQLITNSVIGFYCLYLVWIRKRLIIPTILSMIVTGSFLMAYALKELYGGDMAFVNAPEKMVFGVNIGVLGFGIVFIGLVLCLMSEAQNTKGDNNE
ncbi:MAG: hypothetical protein HWD86_01575 [Kangiellaceae bacterium]|nr:hypothetical protein [Kangiellaceae bacterium]